MTVRKYLCFMVVSVSNLHWGISFSCVFSYSYKQSNCCSSWITLRWKSDRL